MIAGRGGTVGDGGRGAGGCQRRRANEGVAGLDRRRGGVRGVRVRVLCLLRRDAGQQEAAQVVSVNFGVEKERLWLL